MRAETGQHQHVETEVGEAEYFRSKARTPATPEVVEQLRIWEQEFQERATEIELRERGVVSLRSAAGRGTDTE